MVNKSMKFARNVPGYRQSTHAKRELSREKVKARRRARHIDKHNLRTGRDLPPAIGMTDYDAY